MRFFEWDQKKLETKWFANQEKLQYEAGIEYDTSLRQKHPDIDGSTAAKNGGVCVVCYMDFDDDDPECKADWLPCGH